MLNSLERLGTLFENCQVEFARRVSDDLAITARINWHAVQTIGS